MLFILIILISIECKHDCLQKVVNFPNFDESGQLCDVVGLCLKNVKQFPVDLLSDRRMRRGSSDQMKQSLWGERERERDLFFFSIFESGGFVDER